MIRSLCLAALLGAVLPCQNDVPPVQVFDPDAKAAAEAMLKSAEDVQKQVEQLRGYPFRRPVAKAVYTKDQLREFLGTMMAKELGGGKLERTEAWLKCLALLPPSVDLRATMTDVLLSQIGGFYDPERQSFFMMAEASAFGEALNRMMIAHELCHALDDQYLDLRKLMKPVGRDLTEDENYVVGGVAEGSATALMYAWLAKHGQEQGGLAGMAKMAQGQQEQMKVLIEAPPYCTLLAANYMVGLHFLTKGKPAAAMGGKDTGAAIQQAAQRMPRSSEQLLHPEKYWDEQKRDEPVLLANGKALGERIAAEAGGAQVLEQNTLGEMVAALVAAPQQRRLNLMAMAQARYWTNKAAGGWGGDRLFLLGASGGREGKPVVSPGALWFTAWDTVEDREEFVAAVREHRGETPGFAVLESGRLAVFGFGVTPPLSGAFAEALLALPEFTQDGKPWAR